MNIDPAALPSPEGQLRAAALRVTAPRLAVLTAVRSLPHAHVETIVAAVRASIGAVSTQAVYDVLKALTTAGLLRRIEPAGSAALYETRVGDNHHHVICRSCGAVADVDCVVGHAPCLEPSAAQGFSVDEAEVVFWGTCASCSDPAAQRPGVQSNHPA
ncbi:Fur family transcriptional regulator [Nakamurella sp. A5-74]|uniref:Fur family transcriptional regulator n=1 Tax=Nakamurella sp. A5-74 TaxID=3158264 RepID=A0AAU8DLG6_9ACTN